MSTPDDKNVAGVQVGMQSEGMGRKMETKAKETGSAVQVAEGKAPSIRPSDYVKKNGPDPKTVSASDWARVLDAASLGLPLERLWALSGMSDKTFTKYLARFPEKAKEIEGARSRGEYDLTSVVRSCGPGWQGSAWLLERTRGYVARAQLEHTGKGGKELSVSGALLGAFGGSK